MSTIQALDNGRLVIYNIQGAIGTMLVGQSSSSVRLLRESDVTDPQQFRQLWRELIKGRKLEWEETEHDKLRASRSTEKDTSPSAEPPKS